MSWSSRAGRLVISTLAAGALSVLCAPVSLAQIGADLVPSLPPVTDPLSTSSTPAPGDADAGITTEEPTATPSIPVDPEVTDAPGMGTVTGILGGQSVDSPDPGDGGGGAGGGGGDTTTGTGGTGPGAPGAETAGTSGTGTSPGRGDSSGAGTTTTSADEVTGSYGEAARQAAVVAAERAFKLAGPLAPPLILAGLMVGLLIAISRGSERLLKVEQVSGKQTYRL